MDISVIVATRNREKQLHRFLENLCKHECQYNWELVVIDNGSTDNTKNIIETVKARLNLVYLYEERPGKCIALNKGLTVALGNLLVFTDDDVVPDAGWLDNLYQASLAFPQANLFGGRVSVVEQGLPDWIRESKLVKNLLTSQHLKSGAYATYPEWQYPFGLNYAVRKNVIIDSHVRLYDRVGPGTSIPVGDETAFLMQISKPDAQDRIQVPSSNVWHELNPGYLSLRGATRRYYQLGKFDVVLKSLLVKLDDNTPQRTFKRDVWYLAKTRSLPELLCICSRIFGRLVQTLQFVNESAH